MHQPIETNNVKAEIYNSFPATPIPSDLFGKYHRNDDIENEIAARLGAHKWTEISERDWRMLGVSVPIVMRYMTPAAYIYYMPSLLIAALNNNSFDYAVEALIPPNQRHEPRGIWWQQFMQTLSLVQRRAIKRFLAYAADVELDGTSAKMNAEQALCDKLYD